jgi:hypothetical protein
MLEHDTFPEFSLMSRNGIYLSSGFTFFNMRKPPISDYASKSSIRLKEHYFDPDSCPREDFVPLEKMMAEVYFDRPNIRINCKTYYKS